MKKLIDVCDFCWHFTGKLVRKPEGLFHDDRVRKCYKDFTMITNEKEKTQKTDLQLVQQKW